MSPDYFDDRFHKRFDRPTGRSRPRTKDRPDYSDAEVGRVIRVDRGRYQCLIDDRELTAKKATRLGRRGVIVGDLVRLVGDTSGKEGTLARIVEVKKRSTILRRTADDLDSKERPIVANADQVLVVSSLADPPPSLGMIDRIMVAAFDAGIQPILCLTKADLAKPDEVIDAYQHLDVPIFVTQPGADLNPIRRALADRVTVFVGRSGVGKSTLVNSLIPEANLRVGEVSEATGKGKHTSTSANALLLPKFEGQSGWVIDTPGVRSFGLRHVAPETLIRAFPDLDENTVDCPRGCLHDQNSPECGLDIAIEKGRLSKDRVISYRRILEATRQPDY